MLANEDDPRGDGHRPLLAGTGVACASASLQTGFLSQACGVRLSLMKPCEVLTNNAKLLPARRLTTVNPLLRTKEPNC